METATEFLIRKGIRKTYQHNKRYTLTIAEIVEFLDEYAMSSIRDLANIKNENYNPSAEVIRINR